MAMLRFTILQRAALILLLALAGAPAHGAILPITLPAPAIGFSGCVTSGSYDVESRLWMESDSITRCSPSPSFVGRDGTPVTIENFETRLVGRVDHDGTVLGGVFMLFGAIPALGINDRSLLVRGSLMEASYGPAFVGPQAGGIGLNALVALDQTLPAFGDPGDLLLWRAYVFLSGWSYPPGLFPNDAPWQSSVSYSPFQNYTRTLYLIYDRSVFFAPEPATLAMIGLGLVGIVASWRRRGRA